MKTFWTTLVVVLNISINLTGLVYAVSNSSTTESSNLMKNDPPVAVSSSGSSTTTPTTSTSTTEDEPSSTETSEDPSGDRYIGKGHDIIVEHTDFVSLRLHHILNKTTPNNITELRLLQKEEMKDNPVYKEAWEGASSYYNLTKKAVILKAYSKSRIILDSPDEYHIALLAYSGSLYRHFNTKTRELCSGNDVDAYPYKSLFKLLYLATETLGPEIARLNRTLMEPSTSILYRGVGLSFNLTKGQKIAFQHFISTSKDPSVANAFSYWGAEKGGATIFQFKGEDKYPLSHGIYLKVHSYFEGEEEVLLSPMQMFIVEDISREGNSSNVLRVTLKSRPLPQEEYASCELELGKVREGTGEYLWKLKMAVSILGAVLMVVVTVGGVMGVLALINGRRRKGSWGRGNNNKTTSELQLTEESMN